MVKLENRLSRADSRDKRWLRERDKVERIAWTVSSTDNYPTEKRFQDVLSTSYYLHDLKVEFCIPVP